MFKKTLISLAVLGAAAGSAAAADVTISGRIDTGLNYQHSKVSGYGDAFYWDDKDNYKNDAFQMKSGQYSGSRVTITGSEELGNGMTAGFVLENGFDSDDGELGQSGRLFGREAIVYLDGSFGKFAMGRVGALSSGLGSFNLVYGYTPFGTGWGDYAGAKAEFMIGDRDRFDNTITYATPEFAGVKVYAQYSLEADGDEDEKSGANKRYAALGVAYDAGAFSTGLVVDTIRNGRGSKNATNNTEDSLSISWGASYDFGVTKPMILVQYGKNENKLGGFSISSMYEEYTGGEEKAVSTGGLKGFAVSLGAVTPLLGGSLYAAVNYTDGELDGDTIGENVESEDQYIERGDIQRWGVAVGYDYPLSKRTKLYGFAAYNEGEYKGSSYLSNGELDGSGKFKEKDAEVGVGLIHYF